MGLAGGVEVVFDAVLDVGLAALLHFGVGSGLGHALAIELEPGEAAVDVGDVAVALVGFEGDEHLEVGEGGLEVGVGGVAEAGGVVEGGPGGGVEAGAGDDDGSGLGVEVGGFAVVAVADDVEDEDADDDGDEDVVARAEAHRW